MPQRLARVDETTRRDHRLRAVRPLGPQAWAHTLDRYASGVSVATRVIPCLDVDAGRVVKGVNFMNLRDAGDPVELAKAYGEQGADELTFLDVTASSGGRETTYDVVRPTAEQVFIPLTVGGGVRTVDDVDRLLRAGADKVGVNTAAIARPELIAEVADRFGSQVLVLSADVRRRRDDGRGRRRRVRGDDARRAAGDRPRRRRVVRAGRGAGRRRDPAQLDGRRRHEGRLRPRAASRRCAREVRHPDHRQRRRRVGGPLRAGRRARARTRCSRRASSTSGSSRSVTSRRPCTPAGYPSADRAIPTVSRAPRGAR